MDLLFVSLWLFLPAGLANVTPIFAARIPGLQRFDLPVDLGRSVDNIRLLGPNKTWRGLIAGVAVASFVFWLQQLAVANSAALAAAVNSTSEPTLLPYWLLGPLLAIGALVGDLVKSFIKRRSGIAPGRPWFPYDQVDSILGAIALSLLVIRLPLATYAISLLLWTAIQMASQYIGYWLRIKERPI